MIHMPPQQIALLLTFAKELRGEKLPFAMRLHEIARTMKSLLAEAADMPSMQLLTDAQRTCIPLLVDGLMQSYPPTPKTVEDTATLLEQLAMSSQQATVDSHNGLSRDAILIVGVRADGSEAVLGTAPETPRMRMVSIVTNYFAPPSGDPDSLSEADTCLAALQDYQAWLTDRNKMVRERVLAPAHVQVTWERHVKSAGGAPDVLAFARDLLDQAMPTSGTMPPVLLDLIANIDNVSKVASGAPVTPAATA